MTSKAEWQIERCRRTKQTVLNLRSCQISDLSAISDLKHLTELDISHNEISDLTDLSALTHLTFLDISGNRISDLMGLSALVNLKGLDISYNQISNLTDLSALVNLKVLNISVNPISDLTDLSALVNLTTLSIMNNQISDISPLAPLINLTKVLLRGNQLSDISSLLPIIKKGIPIYCDFNLDEFNIDVEDNPLEPSLIAAIKQGNQAVIDYYEQLETQGEEYIHEAKLMIVGEPRAGKTTLRMKLKDVNATMPLQEDSTKGVFIEQERVAFTTLDPLSKKPVPFHYTIWDFGGQDVYKPISQLFVTRSALYVVVISTDHNENDKDLAYWFETLEKLSANSPVIVLENTPTDRKQPKNLTNIESRFAKMWQSLHIVNLNKLIAESLNFDVQQLDTFNILRGAIHRNLEALPHRQDRIPKSWAAIRRAIADKAIEQQPNGQVKPTMPYSAFETICHQNGITDAAQQARLCETLHILGVFLHYRQSDVLKHMIILNNKWATDAAYTVLDDYTVRQNQGVFDRKDIGNIWSDAAYEGNQFLLVALMQQFRLCYNILYTDTYVVPHCLPIYDKDVSAWDNTENVRLIVQYDYLPLATIVQLLVGLHAYIAKDQRWIWQKGGVIEGDNCHAYNTQAYIEQSDEDKELRIRVRGKMTEQIMTTVLNELDKVNKPYPTLVINKLIACNCRLCKAAPKPEYFDYKEHLLHRKNTLNRNTIECRKSGEMVNIDQLLRGVISAEQMRRDSQNSAYDYAERREEKVRELSPLDKVKELITETKLKEAIALLKDYFTETGNKEYVDALTLLAARLKTIHLNYEIGLSDDSAKSVELTKIGKALLFMIHEAEE
jgi:internalin A